MDYPYWADRGRAEPVNGFERDSVFKVLIRVPLQDQPAFLPQTKWKFT